MDIELRKRFQSINGYYESLKKSHLHRSQDEISSKE
jgi:hypothetical protein